MGFKAIFGVFSFIQILRLIQGFYFPGDEDIYANINTPYQNDGIYFRSSSNSRYYRFMVRLLVNNNHQCAGVIIDNYWILTAAHCLVTFGCANLLIFPAIKHPVYSINGINPSECYPHENFDPYTRANDIALIKVPVNLLQNGKMEIALLPVTGTDYPANTEAVALGWGRIEGTYQTTDNLIEGKVYLGDGQRCFNSLENMGIYVYRKLKKNFSPPGIMCTYEIPTNEPGTCLADSGGPILINGILIGILSSGVDVAPYQACDKNIANIEIKVVDYLQWIYAHIDPYINWNPGFFFDYDLPHFMDEERSGLSYL